MSFFINDAIAASSTTLPAHSDNMFSLFMLIGIFVLFYIMLIRPQSKRAKEHKELINQLKKGDEVVTSAGMIAKITHIDEQFVKIAISEGVEMTLQRQAITSILPKGTIKSLN